MKNNITNNDLYNEIKLFIKYFIYEAEKKDKIKHNDNIETLNFQSKIILRPNISFLNCTVQITDIADLYIKIFKALIPPLVLIVSFYHLCFDT